MVEECFYLQKIATTPAILYCNFFLFVGHDEIDYREYQLLQDNKKMDTYLMKNNEQMQAKRVQEQFPKLKGGGKLSGRGRGRGFGRGRGHVIYYNCGQVGDYYRDYTNSMIMCSYCKVMDHMID